jgi:hypothetical protein
MSMRCRSRAFVAGVMLVAGVSVAAAQETRGPGTMELGLFPLGGTFLVGGDDNKEVDFNVYTAGGDVAYYLTERVAIEGEFTVGFGLGQDVMFNRAQVFHVQMPNVWSYFGNVELFPGGANTRLPYYITGGVGAISLQSRLPTKQFGYDVDTVGWQTFLAENIGGGVKIFRAAVPDWGFRIDYRYLIVNAKDDAPAFFAKAKSRGGHRVYFGVLFTRNRGT